MTTAIAIYTTLAIGYGFAGFLRKRVPSTSYPMFSALLLIWGYLFFTSYSLLTIARYLSFESTENSENIVLLISNFIVAFIIGFSLSLIFISRAKFISDKNWLNVLTWTPPGNILTLILRLSKNTKPEIRITKLNVTTVITAIIGLHIAHLQVKEQELAYEVQFHQQQRADFAHLVVEEVSRNQSPPTLYDANGYLTLTDISSSSGTITLILMESESRLFNWDSEALDTWLLTLLCDQSNRFNASPNQSYTIDVEFEVQDFYGQMRWKNIASDYLCARL
jgi:Zn-dependent protease with chaperone function